MHTLEFATRSRCEMRDITPELRAFATRMARERGRLHGALALFCPHTTCGLTVNEARTRTSSATCWRFSAVLCRKRAIIAMPKATATPISRLRCTIPHCCF